MVLFTLPSCSEAGALWLQEDALRKAQQAEDLRAKRHAANEDAERAAVLQQLRDLDAAVSAAEAAHAEAQETADARRRDAAAAEGVAAEAEERRDAVHSCNAVALSASKRHTLTCCC